MHFHAQALYELGVALYTGEGAAEDEAAAAKMFRRAADTGQPAAAYMLGDCLLDGVGVVRDRAEALEWLVTAAELGHRGARSRVLALLEMQEGDDYGKFTDASRQTLVDAVKEGDKSSSVDLMISSTEPKSPEERDQIEGRFQNKQATFERRYTIGGGARNPVVLARRKTIIKESRDAA
jgi:TPR repeat protein